MPAALSLLAAEKRLALGLVSTPHTEVSARPAEKVTPAQLAVQHRFGERVARRQVEILLARVVAEQQPTVTGEVRSRRGTGLADIEQRLEGEAGIARHRREACELARQPDASAAFVGERQRRSQRRGQCAKEWHDHGSLALHALPLFRRL